MQKLAHSFGVVGPSLSFERTLRHPNALHVHAMIFVKMLFQGDSLETMRQPHHEMYFDWKVVLNKAFRIHVKRSINIIIIIIVCK